MVTGLKRDLLIGFVMLAVVVLILGVFIGLIFLLWKFLGAGLILLGIFMIVFFPDVREYQATEVSKTGILLGFIFIIIGIVVLVL